MCIRDRADRHSSVVATGVLGAGSPAEDQPVNTGVATPDGFEQAQNITTEDLRQTLYARGEDSVSVFVQEGRVQWNALPPSGLTEIDGLQVWVDETQQWTVVETPDGVVTIVGLPIDDVSQVLAEVPRTGPGLGDRVHDLVKAVTEQLGYADLG